MRVHRLRRSITDHLSGSASPIHIYIYTYVFVRLCTMLQVPGNTIVSDVGSIRVIVLDFRE